MAEKSHKQQSELAKLIERLSKQNGVHPTTIPSLFLIHESIITEPISRVYEPSFCIILQGEKEVLLGEERFLYGPGDYIVASADLPVTGKVIKATKESPYLALRLEFTSSEVLEVLNDTDIESRRAKNAKRAMFVSEIEPSLLDAVHRLAYLLENPTHIPVLSPLVKKEINVRGYVLSNIKMTNKKPPNMYLVETVGRAIPCFRHGTDYVLNLSFTGPSAYYAKSIFT